MAKDKRVKPQQKNSKGQKFMIFVVALIMLLSAFYWINERPNQQAEPESGNLNVSNVIQYTVVPTVNGSAIVRVESPLNEIVAVPKRPELVRAEVITEVLNVSFPGVSNVTVELSNAYVLFKFEVGDASQVFGNISSQIRSYVGDVKVYRAYSALIGGGRIYLLAEQGLLKGDFVRAILLERQDTYQTIGLQQNRVAVGPTVPVRVTGLSGYFISGVTEEKLNESFLSSEVGAAVVDYAPIAAGVNATGSRLSFTVPERADLESVTALLRGLGVSDVRVYRSGFVSLPQEIAIGDDVLQPASTERSPAVLAPAVRVNDSVNVTISYTKAGGAISSVDIRDASLT